MRTIAARKAWEAGKSTVCPTHHICNYKTKNKKNYIVSLKTEDFSIHD